MFVIYCELLLYIVYAEMSMTIFFIYKSGFIVAKTLPLKSSSQLILSPVCKLLFSSFTLLFYIKKNISLSSSCYIHVS